MINGLPFHLSPLLLCDFCLSHSFYSLPVEQSSLGVSTEVAHAMWETTDCKLEPFNSGVNATPSPSAQTQASARQNAAERTTFHSDTNKDQMIFLPSVREGSFARMRARTASLCSQLAVPVSLTVMMNVKPLRTSRSWLMIVVAVSISMDQFA